MDLTGKESPTHASKGAVRRPRLRRTMRTAAIAGIIPSSTASNDQAVVSYA